MESKPQGTTREEYPSSRLIAQRYPSLRREVIECFAVPKGVQDGLAHFGVDVAPYDYISSGMDDSIRSFCSSILIPFQVFNGIRRSKGKVELTPTQKENVYKSFDKLVEGDGTTECKEISNPLPFVSAIFHQRCPELQRGTSTSSDGATYLMLSVITGDTELCRRCLNAGANPNNMSFLREEAEGSDMFHGYSPMFMAVLAEQIEILEVLSAAGGSIHVYDRWGRTPLHAAVAINSEEVVLWLLEKGAPRYVGDCLNILPAESAEVDYFPEIAMPNPALFGFPKKPSIKYFAKLIEGAKMPRSNNAPLSATLDEENIERCHCISERPKGFCGCVDDMFYRWSMDRLAAMWSPGVDFFALAKRPVKDM